MSRAKKIVALVLGSIFVVVALTGTVIANQYAWNQINESIQEAVAPYVEVTDDEIVIDRTAVEAAVEAERQDTMEWMREWMQLSILVAGIGFVLFSVMIGVAHLVEKRREARQAAQLVAVPLKGGGTVLVHRVEDN